MTKPFIRTALTAIALAVVFSLPATAHSEEKTVQTEIPVYTKLPDLMVGKQPDAKTMEALGEELATGTGYVRKDIVDLLDQVRRLTPPGYELRTPEVIALLVGPGFAKADGARSNAMEMLYKYASPATLSPYGDVFMRALKERADGFVLTLIAKAKTLEAREEVDRLSRLPEWSKPGDSNRDAIRIARAALGDTKIEDEFIAEANRLEAEDKAYELGSALYQLAQIGTRRSLQAVCQRMRSPMIIDLVSAYMRAIRLEAIDALMYAFPERAKFFSVSTDDDYIRIEQFCTQELGVDFRGKPRPGFFTYQGYPSSRE